MFVPFPLGRYTITAPIRIGSMAEVLLGQRVDEDGSVTTWAVKRPLPFIVEDSELLGLFWKETELMQRLRHPSFPRVEEVGVSNGIPFLVMEYVEGILLSDLLKVEAELASEIRLETWVLMASELASAATEVHRFKRGEQVLIHGDIRAGNVIISTQGRTRLLDLGLALANDSVWGSVQRNRSTLPPFLDPYDRQIEVDTFAIGRLLTQCLGGTDSVFNDLSRLPPGLVEVLRKATDSSGLFAYKSAESMRWGLQSYLMQDKIEQMREELSILVGKLMPEKSSHLGPAEE
jgi:eukaryotic-like serine/threonine-protein kinase